MPGDATLCGDHILGLQRVALLLTGAMQPLGAVDLLILDRLLRAVNNHRQGFLAAELGTAADRRGSVGAIEEAQRIVRRIRAR